MILWGSLLSAVILLGGWAALRHPRRHRWRGGAVVGAPQPFGFNMSWMAVQTRDTAKLVKALGLEAVRPANWPAGVAAIYTHPTNMHEVFVTPPVEGWSLVAGLSLPMPMGPAFEDTCTRVLGELSAEFGEAQLFVSYPELAYFCWVRMRDGKLVRGFASGPEGVIWNRGALTAEEREIAPTLFDLYSVDGRDTAGQAFDINAHHVASMAKRWSVDPTALDERGDVEVGSGYLARARRSWRPRLKVNAAA